jgi:hypothetical protein
LKSPQVLSAVVILDRTGEILAMRRSRREFGLTALDKYWIWVIAAKNPVSDEY